MRRRVLRPHVEDKFIGVEKSLIVSAEVLMGRRQGVGRIAHCPLSIPKLACTHSWSCWRMPNMSNTSLSSQFAADHSVVTLGAFSCSEIKAFTRMRSLRGKE